MAKLTPAEKQRRREEQSAARKNAKLRDEVPLFADLLPEYSAEGEHWHWRRNKALAGEHLAYIAGSQLLAELAVCQWIRPFAASVVGTEAFTKLDAHCQRVYQSKCYWYGFWRDVLTGKRIELQLKRVENRQPGQPAVICTDWYECRHMSQEEFYQLFPYHSQAPPDGGFEREGEAILARLGHK